MPSPPNDVIRFERVTKRFGCRVALDDVSFYVAAGEILALLGPNGAGKSTALGIVLGHLGPSTGEVWVHGVPVRRDRRGALRGLGAVPEAPAFYEYLTGAENLRCFAAYSGDPDPATLDESVRFVGLVERIDDLVRTYSRGMRQRLALAQALVPTPDVVVLDEPAEGLDPEGIADVHALVARLRRERGVTVVMASHLLAEAEAVCDRAIVLDGGRIVFAGPCREATTAGRFRVAVDDAVRAAATAAALGVGVDGDVLDIGRRDVGDVVAALVAAGVRVRAVEPIRETLRDRYLRRARRGPT